MLLKRQIVLLPAQEEIDADLAEYGSIGMKVAAEYGRAAVDVGAPDKEGPQTELTDTLANIMHYANYYEHDFEAALVSARNHFEAERTAL